MTINTDTRRSNPITIAWNRKLIDIKFQDVSYRIPQGRNAPKTILKNVSGTFKNSQLTAILGPSGAGKSTLLNVLAGYKYHGCSGSIYVNGKLRDMKEFRRLSRYIMQEDLLPKWLTVEELMMVAADLKLSSRLCLEDKKKAIHKILDLLRLTSTKDTMTDKLSGGERKRLAIGLELVNNPPVVFLDEPTTGLDDMASTQCMALLKSLAQDGRTIICSIHTPSAKLFALFDQAYVLAEGMCVYQGYGPQVVEYLSNVGLVCPTHYNPADFIIEVCSGEYGNFTDKLALIVKSQYSNSHVHDEYIEKDTNDFEANKAEDISLVFQFKTILFRMWRQMLRDKNYILLKLVLHIALGVFIGYIFYDVANDGSKTIYNFGLFYCCMMFFLYIPLMPILLYFPTEVQLIKREYFNRWYSLKAYFAAMTVSTLPSTIFMAIFFLTSIYIISGQPIEYDRILKFFSICILTAFVSESFGLIVSSFLNVVNSMFVGPSCSVPFMLLAVYGMGFGNESVPLIMKVIMHLSYLRYSLEGTLTAMMRGRGTISCSLDDSLCLAFADTNVFLHMMGFEERSVWFDIGILLLIYLTFRIICYNLLRQRLSPNKTFRALQLIVRLVKSHISISR